MKVEIRLADIAGNSHRKRNQTVPPTLLRPGTRRRDREVRSHQSTHPASGRCSLLRQKRLMRKKASAQSQQARPTRYQPKACWK